MALTRHEPNITAAKVAYHRKQLDKLLLRASDDRFLQMVWAIDALRFGNPEAAKTLVKFPPEAIDQSIGSRFAIHRWELETLLIQLMLTSGSGDGTTIFDCSDFSSIAKLVNRLREVENTETGLYLRGSKFDVFDDLHRSFQRQFHWQDGYFNRPQMYRYAYIYGQGKCAEYFAEKHGLPLSDLILAGFALFTQSIRSPWVSRQAAVPEVGLTKAVMEKALPLLSVAIGRAREQAAKMVEDVTKAHGGPIPTAFLPSILRQSPLLSTPADEGRLIAPIPEVILLRVTSGLYYDIIPGGDPDLRNEAADRFEQYCANIIDAQMERFVVRRAYKYELKKGAPFDTPDLMIADANDLALVAECKATKLTYLAQFAEDPFAAAIQQYEQLAKGVFQLWRFFSHARRGLISEPVSNSTAAMVLTLDSFLVMGRKLRDKIMQEASALADAAGEIVEADRRHIIFCPAHRLEQVLSLSTEDQFVASLAAAEQEKYRGWEFPEISREVRGREKIAQKKYPFALGELLPWWELIPNLKPGGPGENDAAD